MNIVITGADGFLGRHLCAAFLLQGWKVTGLVRNPHRKRLIEGVEYHHYEFPANLAATALVKSFDVLVHCAFAMTGNRADYDVNREASAFLQQQFQSTRMLFVSSMSAHADAESLYGREKLYIESTLDLRRDVALRPGFIIGDGGVFQNLARSIRKLPLIPLFYGGQQPIQTVHVADLCAAVCVLIGGGGTGVISYGEEEPVLLREFYQAIAQGLGVKRTLMRLPGGLTLSGLRLAESLGIRLPMTSENLLGLKRLIRVPVASDRIRLGLPIPRTMSESLATVNWSSL